MLSSPSFVLVLDLEKYEIIFTTHSVLIIFFGNLFFFSYTFICNHVKPCIYLYTINVSFFLGRVWKLFCNKNCYIGLIFLRPIWLWSNWFIIWLFIAFGYYFKLHFVGSNLMLLLKILLLVFKVGYNVAFPRHLMVLFWTKIA